jgi:hypothetical protein
MLKALFRGAAISALFAPVIAVLFEALVSAASLATRMSGGFDPMRWLTSAVPLFFIVLFESAFKGVLFQNALIGALLGALAGVLAWLFRRLSPPAVSAIVAGVAMLLAMAYLFANDGLNRLDQFFAVLIFAACAALIGYRVSLSLVRDRSFC